MKHFLYKVSYEFRETRNGVWYSGDKYIVANGSAEKALKKIKPILLTKFEPGAVSLTITSIEQVSRIDFL